MSNGNGQAFDERIERLQGLLASLEGLSDPAAKAAAQELVQVVIDLHALGLSDLMATVRETGAQPADTLLPKFAANPRVRGMLLLHDLHPDDLATRARQAVDRVQPHLGAQGVRAELQDVDDGVIRILVRASGQNSQRPAADQIHSEIEGAVLDMAPDADDLIIQGLETTSDAHEAYVPLAAISRAGAAGD